MKQFLYILLILILSFSTYGQLKPSPSLISVSLGSSEPVTPEQTIVLTTTSTSSTWSPQEIINSGNTLVWEVTGAITIADTTLDDPTFDMTGNTTSTVTIKSVTNFIGFTVMQLDGLAITSANISEGGDLIKLDFYPSTIGTIDLTSNLDLQFIWMQDCALTALDVAVNTVASDLRLDFNNSLGTIALDKLIVDLDANGVTNGLLKILTNPGLPLSSSVYSEYQSLVTKGWTIDAASPPDPDPPPPGTTAPLLYDFEIIEGQLSRIYFKSSEIITASTVTGFSVTDKTISSVTINTGLLTGHYFTISAPFTHWSNHTIRYGGGSNIQDATSDPVLNFDLQYIENNTTEPSASTLRYATVSGAGTHNGTIGNEWTLAEACLNASSGMTVHIESGDYGSGNFVIANNGTALAPIKFEGYENVAGDSPTLIKNQNTTFSADIMPYIHTTSISGNGLSLNGRDYVYVRNIQIEGYNNGIVLENANNCTLDNVYVMDSNLTSITCFAGYLADNVDNRIINSYTANAHSYAIRVRGTRFLIADNYVATTKTYNQDYYITMKSPGGGEVGSHIVRGNIVRRYASDTHGGHGINFRSNANQISYCLAENNHLIDLGSPLEARNGLSMYNVYRFNLLENIDDTDAGGIRFSSSLGNIFDSNTLIGGGVCLDFLASTEDVLTTHSAVDNIIKNNVFIDKLIGIKHFGDLGGLGRVPTGNRIINNTWHNITYMYKNEVSYSGSDNLIINSIISEVANKDMTVDASSWEESYTDFFSTNAGDWSYTAEAGTGNISTNPNFTNIAANDFSLSGTTPITVYDGGLDNSNVRYDKSAPKAERVTLKFSMGAYEKD